MKSFQNFVQKRYFFLFLYPGNTVLSSINGINVSDVVLSGSEQVQVISGQKVFLQGLSLHGNVKVDLMNGIRVSDEYRNGIFNNEDVQIAGNIVSTNSSRFIRSILSAFIF